MTTTTDTQTGVDLIRTGDQLRAYLDAHPERHARQEDGTCACGYPGVPQPLLEHFHASTAFPTQEEHAEAVLIGALGDLLPSDTSEKTLDSDGNVTGQRILAWRELAASLYEEINERDRNVDPRLIALMHWCLEHEHADIGELADITAMHPRYLAALLSRPYDGPDDEDQDQEPGT